MKYDPDHLSEPEIIPEDQFALESNHEPLTKQESGKPGTSKGPIRGNGGRATFSLKWVAAGILIACAGYYALAPNPSNTNVNNASPQSSVAAENAPVVEEKTPSPPVITGGSITVDKSTATAYVDLQFSDADGDAVICDVGVVATQCSSATGGTESISASAAQKTGTSTRIAFSKLGGSLLAALFSTECPTQWAVTLQDETGLSSNTVYLDFTY